MTFWSCEQRLLEYGLQENVFHSFRFKISCLIQCVTCNFFVIICNFGVNIVKSYSPFFFSALIIICWCLQFDCSLISTKALKVQINVNLFRKLYLIYSASVILPKGRHVNWNHAPGPLLPLSSLSMPWTHLTLPGLESTGCPTHSPVKATHLLRDSCPHCTVAAHIVFQLWAML